MSIFKAMKINLSGLSAQRLKMDTISSNIANASTTRTEEGGPYRRKEVLFEENLKNELNPVTDKIEKMSSGVKVSEIKDDNSELKKVYNPDHPDADEEGYVLMPNVDMLNEMVDLISASRAYEANVTALKTSKGIMIKALEIGRG